MNGLSARQCFHFGGGYCLNGCGYNGACKIDAVRELQSKPREMTREDLGLRTRAETNAAIHKWLLERNGLYRRLVMGDAPYAFWLGANA